MKSQFYVNEFVTTEENGGIKTVGQITKIVHYFENQGNKKEGLVEIEDGADELLNFEHLKDKEYLRTENDKKTLYIKVATKCAVYQSHRSGRVYEQKEVHASDIKSLECNIKLIAERLEHYCHKQLLVNSTIVQRKNIDFIQGLVNKEEVKKGKEELEPFKKWLMDYLTIEDGSLSQAFTTNLEKSNDVIRYSVGNGDEQKTIELIIISTEEKVCLNIKMERDENYFSIFNKKDIQKEIDTKIGKLIDMYYDPQKVFVV